MDKPILWASRHSIDPATLDHLPWTPGLDLPPVVRREILWPADYLGCVDLARRLADEFSLLLGVWPAQAIEAWCAVLPEKTVRVLSTVSVPETEPDIKKTRPFRFVRWAVIR